MRFLRGTPLDLFGYSRERRADKQLIVSYEELLLRFLEELDETRFDLAVELARLPESIRGYGPVKNAAMHSVGALEKELLEAWPRSQ